jgi:C-terminal processing protease CtpA/Prc
MKTPVALLLALSLLAISSARAQKPAKPSTSAAQVTTMPSSEQLLTNLRAFTKLYGYVRYFHPSDEASRLDWNTFAVYGVGKVKDARTTEELKSTLEQMFLPVAPTLQILRVNDEPRELTASAHSALLKIVAWQHKGLGTGVLNVYGDDPPYQSLRLNRGIKSGGERGDFGGVRNYIAESARNAAERYPVRKLWGNEIKFTAAVRAEVDGAEDYGVMWLRVDRNDGRAGFVTNSVRIRTSAWDTYTIVGTVDTNAISITFGCMLHGKGKVWVDDVRLLTRTASEKNWKPIEISNGGFEKFTTTNSGRQAYKEWEGGGRSYVITPSTESPFEGDYCALIEYIAPEQRNTTKELFTTKPTFGETRIKNLGGGLRCVLPIALYDSAGKTSGSTPESTKAFATLEAVLANESQRSAGDLDREPVRLANVIIAWSTLQHFYPYFDVVRTNWDSVLTSTLTATLASRVPQVFPKIMRGMFTALRDGHAEYYSLRKGFTLDVKVENVEGQPVIIASQDSLLQRGDVLVKVDGYDARARLHEEESLVSGTPQWKRAHAAQDIILSPGKTLSLTVNRNGILIEIIANCKPVAKSSVWEHPALERLSGSSPEDAVWYIDMSQVSLSTIEAKAAELAKAKGVVLDMRGYPKDDNLQMVGYLASSALMSPRWNVPQAVYPDGENAQRYDTSGRWSIEPRAPRWNGKAVFLTGGGAFSQAETIMSIVEQYQLGAIVGETTAGANGNVIVQMLPGGASFRWTGMKVLKHDGAQHHLVGVKPTHSVTRTVQGIRAGRDEVLRKGIEVLQGMLKKR